MDRPGLLGRLDARMERIRGICEEEGASTDQFATWMTSAMAEEIRGATVEEFEASYRWLNQHTTEVAELRQVGDYMQSAASRVSAWVTENVDGAQIPYEESMAMRELASAIDKWTNVRRQSKPVG